MYTVHSTEESAALTIHCTQYRRIDCPYYTLHVHSTEESTAPTIHCTQYRRIDCLYYTLYTVQKNRLPLLYTVQCVHSTEESTASTLHCTQYRRVQYILYICTMFIILPNILLRALPFQPFSYYPFLYSQDGEL